MSPQDDQRHDDPRRDGERQGDERRVLRFPSGTPEGGEPLQQGDGTLARLLEIAGPRPAPPEDLRREVRQAAYAAWQEKVQEHSRTTRRQVWRLAAAAVVIVGLGLALLRTLGPELGPGPTPSAVATVEALYGDVELRGAEPGSGPGTGLPAGTILETGGAAEGNGRVALRLADGASVRLDAGSRLLLAAARELVLDHGAVYLDTGREAPGTEALAVRTSFGVARDVGTQFEVRVAEETLQVRVREGRVEVDTGAETHAAAAGVALRVDARGRAEREPIAAHGTTWSWVLDASPPFELEGRTLAEYLRWLTRETGWRVEYEDPELRREADEITVHGSVTDLRPDETPDLVLSGAALHYRLQGGVLVVGR